MGVGAGLLGGGGIVGLLALGTLTACLVAALATAMDVWLAALIVTVVYGALAGGLALTGKSRVSEATPPVPEQTVETVKEDRRDLGQKAQEAVAEIKDTAQDR